MHPEIFDFVDSRQIICRDTFFGFHKKNEKGKEKVVFQGEGIKYRKGGCTTSLHVGVCREYK